MVHVQYFRIMLLYKTIILLKNFMHVWGKNYFYYIPSKTGARGGAAG